MTPTSLSLCALSTAGYLGPPSSASRGPSCPPHHRPFQWAQWTTTQTGSPTSWLSAPALLFTSWMIWGRITEPQLQFSDLKNGIIKYITQKMTEKIKRDDECHMLSPVLGQGSKHQRQFLCCDGYFCITLGRWSALKCNHCLIESAGISGISSISVWADNSKREREKKVDNPKHLPFSQITWSLLLFSTQVAREFQSHSFSIPLQAPFYFHVSVGTEKTSEVTWLSNGESLSDNVGHHDKKHNS